MKIRTAEAKNHYGEWLCDKVNKTLESVAASNTRIHEHSDAMALIRDRLKARLRYSTPLGTETRR